MTKIFVYFLLLRLESVFPPVFGHRLQAQVAKRGERVLMDVEVSGIPDPTVTWYKNNVLLDPAEYKVKKSGNNYTLVIEKGEQFRNVMSYDFERMIIDE